MPNTRHAQHQTLHPGPRNQIGTVQRTMLIAWVWEPGSAVG